MGDGEVTRYWGKSPYGGCFQRVCRLKRNTYKSLLCMYMTMRMYVQLVVFFFNDENQFIELVAGTKVCFLCFGPDGG